MVMRESDLPLLLTVRQLADLTGMNEEAIRRLCQSGQVEARKIGHKWFIYRDRIFEGGAR